MNGGTVSSAVYNIGNLQTNGILLPHFANCQNRSSGVLSNIITCMDRDVKENVS